MTLEPAQLNTANDLIALAAKRALKPKPRLTGSEWADRFRMVAPGTSPEPGLWRTSRVPYMKEILDAATSPRIERVVIMAASQVGKSEAIINVLGFFMDQEPAPILMLQPTVEAAEAFSKERIDPTLQVTPCLKEKLLQLSDDESRGKSRKTASTIRMKQFIGGYLAMVGSNSPAGLASRPIRVLLMDEIDRYGSTQEGDPIKLATQRTQNFHNRKIIMVSTPTTEVRSDGPTIYENFSATDQREFMPKCPHCGKRYLLQWANVKWDKTQNDEVIDDSIRMECPHCGKKVRGNGKPNPYDLASAEWVAQKPENKVRGYHLNALASPWVSLTELVHEFVQAKNSKDMQGLQEFINLKLGEPWHEAEQDLDLWEKLSDRREWYTRDSLPAGVLILTCGVDVQRDRLEASVYGWGEQWETWGVCHRVLYGDPLQSKVWSDLDALLMQIFRTEDERELRITCTFIDSGDGATTESVYNYVQTREAGRVYAIKGQGGEGVPLVNRPSTSNRYKVHLFSLGVDGGRTNLLHRLKIRDIGPCFWHFTHDPEAGHDSTFFKQLTCEVKSVRFVGGRAKVEWIKMHGERNEAEDCAIYAMAAAELLHPNFETLKQLAGNQTRTNETSMPRRFPMRRSAIMSSVGDDL